MATQKIDGLLDDERYLGDKISHQAPWADDDASVYRLEDGYLVTNEEYDGDGESLGSLGQWFEA